MVTGRAQVQHAVGTRVGGRYVVRTARADGVGGMSIRGFASAMARRRSVGRLESTGTVAPRRGACIIHRTSLTL